MKNEFSADIQSRVIDYLDGLEQRTSKAEQFIASEAPIYIQEYLSFKTNETLFMMGVILSICLFLLIVITTIVYCDFKVIKHEDERQRGAISLICTVFIAALFIMPSIELVTHTTEYIKLVSAPRVVVVEHLQELVQGK